MAEFSLIDKFCKGIGAVHPETKLSVGDDAAVVEVPKGMELAISVDTMVAGVHFYPDVSPEKIAHKLLAVNLSDMAAMGAQPKWATMTLTTPTVDQDWLSKFASTLSTTAKAYGVQLIGGDTTQGELNLSIQIMGLLPKGKALSRSGSKPEDDLYLSNNIGDAALALKLINDKKVVNESLVKALELPEPQVALGLELLSIANSCIDVSDGVVADCSHIARQSQVSIEIDIEKLPLSDDYLNYIAEGGDRDLALTGGDDYQLAFTAPQTQRNSIDALSQQLGHKLTRVGRVKEQGAELVCLFNHGQPYQFKSNAGYQHFQ